MYTYIPLTYTCTLSIAHTFMYDHTYLYQEVYPNYFTVSGECVRGITHLYLHCPFALVSPICTCITHLHLLYPFALALSICACICITHYPSIVAVNNVCKCNINCKALLCVILGMVLSSNNEWLQHRRGHVAPRIGDLSLHTLHPCLDHRIPQKGSCQRSRIADFVIYRVIMAQQKE